MKIAFDENIPIAMVRVFKTFAAERQLQYLTRGLTIESAKDYTPDPSDADFVKKNDVPWIRRFSAAGGKVIISGDTEMQNQPHERLALVQEGMIVVFFEKKWAGWQFCHKCALLLHWWPVIVCTIKKAQPGSFWHVPTKWDGEGSLRSVSNRDKKALKVERQMRAQTKIAGERRKRRSEMVVSDQIPLSLNDVNANTSAVED